MSGQDRAQRMPVAVRGEPTAAPSFPVTTAVLKVVPSHRTAGGECPAREPSVPFPCARPRGPSPPSSYALHVPALHAPGRGRTVPSVVGGVTVSGLPIAPRPFLRFHGFPRNIASSFPDVSTFRSALTSAPPSDPVTHVHTVGLGLRARNYDILLRGPELQVPKEILLLLAAPAAACGQSLGCRAACPVPWHLRTDCVGVGVAEWVGHSLPLRRWWSLSSCSAQAMCGACAGFRVVHALAWAHASPIPHRTQPQAKKVLQDASTKSDVCVWVMWYGLVRTGNKLV